MYIKVASINRNRRNPARSLTLRKARWRRRLAYEILEDRHLLAIDWHNYENALDVTGDGDISPIDVLQIVNQINAPNLDSISGRLQPRPASLTVGQFYDTDNDGFLTPLDVLMVVNAINAGSRTPASLLQYRLDPNNSSLLSDASSDPMLGSNSTIVSRMSPFNRPPVLDPIPDQVLSASTPKVVQLSAKDPDGDAITLTSTLVRLDAQAYQLDRDYGFRTDGSNYENYGGRGEKWFLGSNRWYFILPDGGVYEWDNSNQATGTKIAQLDRLYHAYPNQLYDATNPASIVEPTLVTVGDKLTVTLPANQSLAFTVQVVAADPAGATDSKSFLVIPKPTPPNHPPVLAKIENRTVLPAASDIVPLQATDPDGDALTFSAVVLRQDGEAYQLDQTYDFHFNGTSFENYGGRGEKWFLGGSDWYFILPDGSLIKWDKAFGANGTTIAKLDPLYHAHPNQLYDATDPALIVEPMLQIVGDKLTVTMPPNQRLAFSINVTASDPMSAFDAQSFIIDTPVDFHINRPPTIAPILDHTLDAGVSRQITLAATDPDNDPITFSARLSRLDALAYQLDQTYGFDPYQNLYENYGGLNEKWFRGKSNWFFILPSGDLYEWDSGHAATGTLIAKLDSLYHRYPEQLASAVEPGSIVEPSITVVGDSLSIRMPLDQKLAFTVIVTASDPSKASDAKSFILNSVDAESPQISARLSNDTGVSDTDRLTFDPTVQGTVTKSLGDSLIEAAFEEQSIARFMSITDQLSNGSFTLDRTHLVAIAGGPLADGLHRLLLRIRDSSGRIVNSTNLEFVLDTTAPTNTQFDLAISSDTEPVGDQQTSYNRVTLVGTTEPGARLQRLPAGEKALANNLGSFFVSNIALNKENNAITFEVLDLAGNAGSAARTLTRLPAFVTTDPVIDWNHQALEAIRLDADTPPEASRTLAIVHSAILDAVNAIDGTPGRYVSLPAQPSTSALAAVASAAHRVLSHEFPAQQSALDAKLAQSLGQVPTGQGKTNGIALGRAIADAILALREHDGYDAFKEYFGGTNPGQWQATAPMYDVALLPQWGDIKTFVVSDVNSILPAGPPALSSQAYAAAFNEVKAIGSANSSTRTADQTAMAKFWADGKGTYTPAGHWNQIAEIVSQSQGSSLADNARLFAQLNTGLADAAILAWNVKYANGFWRPITAIQQADTDGNDQTTADPKWTPLLATPPFPEYVSGHSAFSGAAATILNNIFGNNVAFTVGSFTPTNLVRTFSSFDSAASEASYSRILGGIHYKFSGDDGLALGRRIGEQVLAAFSSSKDTQPPTIVLDQPPTAIAHNIDIHGQMLDNLVSQLGIVRQPRPMSAYLSLSLPSFPSM